MRSPQPPKPPPSSGDSINQATGVLLRQLYRKKEKSPDLSVLQYLWHKTLTMADFKLSSIDPLSKFLNTEQSGLRSQNELTLAP